MKQTVEEEDGNQERLQGPRRRWWPLSGWWYHGQVKAKVKLIWLENNMKKKETSCKNTGKWQGFKWKEGGSVHPHDKNWWANPRTSVRGQDRKSSPHIHQEVDGLTHYVNFYVGLGKGDGHFQVWEISPLPTWGALSLEKSQMLVLVFLDFYGMAQKMSTHWDTLTSSSEAADWQGMAWWVAKGWDSIGTHGLLGHIWSRPLSELSFAMYQ